MLIPLILGLVIGGTAVIFVWQNIFLVTVSFLSWELTASLAILIVTSLVIGATIVMLFIFPGKLRDSFVLSRLKKENEELRRKLGSMGKANEVTPTGPTEKLE